MASLTSKCEEVMPNSSVEQRRRYDERAGPLAAPPGLILSKQLSQLVQYVYDKIGGL